MSNHAWLLRRNALPLTIRRFSDGMKQLDIIDELCRVLCQYVCLVIELGLARLSGQQGVRAWHNHGHDTGLWLSKALTNATHLQQTVVSNLKLMVATWPYNDHLRERS